MIFSLGGSALLFVVFCIIRPHSSIVYAPKTRGDDDRNKKLAAPGKHPLSWIRVVLRAKNDELLEYIGLDATLYIMFISMLRNLFLIFSVFGILIMIPINVIYNRKSSLASSVSKNDAFVLLTPTLIYGNTLYAHVFVTWLFDGIILFFLWRMFNKVIAMRRKKYMTEEYQNALFMRTLMVTEIPKKFMSDEGLKTLMGTLKVSEPIQNASVGRDVTELAKLIRNHKHSVKALEAVLAKYLKDPDHVPAARPTMKPYKGDTTVRSRVDAIDYLCQRISSLEKQITSIRETIDYNKVLPYGFVSYESVENCHIVASATKQKRKGKLNAVLAPRPVDIIWDNIVLTRAQRTNKQYWGNLLFVILMVLWIVPNAFLGSFLSNLGRIGALWKDFDGFIYNYPILFSILQGVLSPIVTSLIFLILPAIMRRMSQWQGKVTKHEREMDVTRKLYTFFVFNNLFVFTVFSVAWTIVAKIINIVNNEKGISFKQAIDELQVAQQLSTAILTTSSFWVMYILRVNFGALLDLLQLVSLLYRGFRRRFMSPTPRELMLWTAPQHFGFASYYNWMMFYTTIALSFAMVQPLVLPIIAFYFSLDTIFKKYSLMYVFETKAETDGLYWPLLFNSLLFATGFGNAVLFAVVWVQGGWRKSVWLAPLLVVLIVFKICSMRYHNHRFYYFIPTEKEKEQMDMVRTRTNLSDMSATALERRYRNPAITGKLIVPMVHAKAQHLLPRICNLESYDGDDAEMERAFIADFDHTYIDDTGAYEGYKMDDLSRDPVTTKKFGDRFEIIDEDELNYERYQEIEKARMATPFNPYLNNPYMASPPPVRRESDIHYNPYANAHAARDATLTPPPAHNHPYPRHQASFEDLSSVNSFPDEYGMYPGGGVQSRGVLMPERSYQSGYNLPLSEQGGGSDREGLLSDTGNARHRPGTDESASGTEENPYLHR